MSVSLTQQMRAGLGGKAWRCYRFDHAVVGTNPLLSVSAASLDLTYIECVIGEHAGVPVATAATASVMMRMAVSITANNASLVWVGSTEAVTQYITIVGW